MPVVLSSVLASGVLAALAVAVLSRVNDQRHRDRSAALVPVRAQLSAVPLVKKISEAAARRH